MTIILSIIFIFVGRVSFHHISELIVYEFGIDIVFDIVTIVPAVLLVRYLKQSEGIDVYDFSTNFNPFKFNSQYDDKDEGMRVAYNGET